MLNTDILVDGRYKILRKLGQGGAGCVYLAENIRLHNLWAIKEVIKAKAEGDALIAESSILTNLRHPGLPAVIDVIDTPESYLIVMEYIEGQSLDKVLDSQGACAQADVVRWGQQLCDVLGYLHTQNPPIIYRDMKPANIMLKPDGNVVLIDFGIARKFDQHKNRDTSLLGTYGYAAPEQYKGDKQTDARSDIYSLGVTLYHLVTGRDPCIPPYGINPLKSIDPSLSSKLDNVIKKCTALEPEDRYSTAAELKQYLASVVSKSGEKVKKVRSSKPKLWIAIAILLIVTGVAAGGVALTQGIKHTSENPKQTESKSESVSFREEVYISDELRAKSVKFTPPASGFYRIYSESAGNIPSLEVYTAGSDVAMTGEGNTYGFDAEYWLEEGKTYYFNMLLNTSDGLFPTTGSFMLCVDYIE